MIAARNLRHAFASPLLALAVAVMATTGCHGPKVGAGSEDGGAESDGPAAPGGQGGGGGGKIGTGGATGAGGATATDGGYGTGGANGGGGTTDAGGGVGGAVGGGGNAGTGGTAGTDGTGGASGIGGAPGTGGAVGTGGALGAGGALGTGGTPATGGAPGTGGIGTGGAPGTGGVPGTGGTGTGGTGTGGAPGTGGVPDAGCGDACATGPALQCSGTVLQAQSGGQWVTSQVCGQTCDPTVPGCTNVATCSPGSRRCTDSYSQICNDTGTAWLPVEMCAGGCNNGLCGACTPSATRCNGNVPETCNLIGTTWIASPACSSTYCAKGACAEPTLVVDGGSTVTVQDEHYYMDFIVRAGSTVNVPDGRLVIHAHSFIVEAGAHVVVTPTGTDPRGKGYDGACNSCYTNCSSTIAGYCVGANGGSYGSKGGALSYYGSYNGCYCSGTVEAPAAWGVPDTEFAFGSPGGNSGNCGAGGVAGKGGGVLVVYADTIQMAGSISATGQNASGGCAGGGSGGAVALIARTELDVPGTIDVSGGAGGNGSVYGSAGGSGVVKLLYGDGSSITGSFNGTAFQSLSPPLDMVSMTHPDPARVYNDGFPSVELAWNRPFSSNAGYYYALNGTTSFVPTPANGTPLGREAMVFPGSRFVQGKNNFHIDSVNASSSVGTVESRFTINVNTHPPAVSSSSNPNSTTWYSSTSVSFNWTVYTPDADIPAFHYVFDRYPNTVPTRADTALPVTTRGIGFSSQAPGIWFFHIVNEDTKGYVTRNAGTYRVQLGPDPGSGNLWGTVTDAGMNAIAGATVTLNRGLITMSTDATGAFAFPNAATTPPNALVYAQSYEVRASKPGFADAVTTAVAQKGMTVLVNLVLTPGP